MDHQEPEVDTERRTILKAALCAGVALHLAPIGGSTDAMAQGDPRKSRPQPGDRLVFASGDRKGEPIGDKDIQQGRQQVMAYGQDPGSETVRDGSRLNKVMLIRLDPADLDEETRKHAADGIVAFSAVCSHAGCDVSGWHGEEKILECPCHHSKFDPRAGGKVVGGPAPRRLALLPLENGPEGLVVAAAFIGKVGAATSA
ncbi:Rieske (2Fe-2S) protein [Skermanella sp. TT6]|uniref:Rieske (2Fe-2S) protein n=1 Tax=Skermanella cutis TaxID=2775420 RepID=A0ABX7AZI2_9PROT|nr:Rieske (2Fe-2S) protein [Skermanella sp. TT6]QQP87277.1 Rieske (2Fe-2S) protein [Skermanella sp. TT6]